MNYVACWTSPTPARSDWSTASSRGAGSSASPELRTALQKMGYTLDFEDRTSGPINAIFFDRKHGTFWGGSSNHGDDYGIAW